MSDVKFLENLRLDGWWNHHTVSIKKYTVAEVRLTGSNDWHDHIFQRGVQSRFAAFLDLPRERVRVPKLIRPHVLYLEVETNEPKGPAL